MIANSPGINMKKVAFGLSFFGALSTGPTTGTVQNINAPQVTFGTAFPTFSEYDYPTMQDNYTSSLPGTWDTTAHCRWFPITTPSIGWINYTDQQSAIDKINYCITSGLGGVHIWSLDKDYMPTGGNPRPALGPHPLLAAVHRSNFHK